jgi:hypothetical protein
MYNTLHKGDNDDDDNNNNKLYRPFMYKTRCGINKQMITEMSEPRKILKRVCLIR